jgi:predicted RNA-binding Zn-ribbon protein involved in translation (DUF1610 family)
MNATAQTNKMICPDCGVEMNHHANKVEYVTAYEEGEEQEPVFGGTLVEAHTCPECGQTATRPVGTGD